VRSPRRSRAIPSCGTTAPCGSVVSSHSGVFGHVHHATPDEEQAAFEYFERHADKEYSFVDCLSCVMMRKLGIHEAWAVDSDFTHHGFLVRPGPRPPP